MNFPGFFEHFAQTDDSQRVATRKAVAVATKRVEDRFGPYLRSAKTPDELRARLSLVEDEMREAIADAVEEHGVEDADAIYTAVAKHAGGAYCDDCKNWKHLPDGCTCGDDDSPKESSRNGELDGPGIDDELADAPSAVGGEPKPKMPIEAAGPLPSLFQEGVASPGLNTPPAAGAAPNLPASGGSPGPSIAQGMPNSPAQMGYGTTPQPAPTPAPATSPTPPPLASPENLHHDLAMQPGAADANQGARDFQPEKHNMDNYNQIGQQYGLSGQQVQDMLKNYQAHTAADAPAGAGGAVKREKLPTGDNSGLGGPSPKIDKSKSGDEWSWNTSDIDTETSGTPKPSVTQDVSELPDYTKDDFLRFRVSMTRLSSGISPVCRGT
jgi:hypothetical protein